MQANEEAQKLMTLLETPLPSPEEIAIAISKGKESHYGDPSIERKKEDPKVKKHKKMEEKSRTKNRKISSRKRKFSSRRKD
jgi:hypothetical protein